MRRRSQIALGSAFLVACIVALVILLKPPVLPLPTVKAGPSDDSPWFGTASCSGRGCHGRVEPGGETHPTASSMSYTTWFLDDKHADAFEALQRPAGQQIADRLELGSAAESERCLACHTNPATATAAASPAQRAERRFGVGCESCHGTAKDWIGPHCSQTWKRLDDTDRRKKYECNGMTWLQSPSIAARVCAGCHVGEGPDLETGRPARDVNHDLIAAGHPRLSFEYSTYLANMPRHWQEKPSAPGSGGRVWAVGQVVCARADLDLLAYRAASGGPWPEFAAYDCASCHHDLREPSWRRNRANRDLPPGAMRPANWYDALLPVVIEAFPAIAAAPPDPRDLRAALSRPHSDRTDVARLARSNAAALSGLAAILEEGGMTRKQLVDLRTALARRGEATRAADWDELEQIGLALMAVNRAYQAGVKLEEADSIVDAAIRELVRRLAYPVGYQSPKPFRQTERFDADLEELFHRIGRYYSSSQSPAKK